MNMVLAVVLGALLGGATVWVIVARKHVKKAMFDEIERDARFGMRSFLGYVLPGFSATIRSISPQFCTVYKEASLAESYGLDQVCGVGYGKALEFLIKDYAKRENSSVAGDIEKASLVACIERYISDPGIRNSSNLARWLRNDETHYVRKYLGRDIKDLRRLIDLTVALIENAERRRDLERQTDEEKRKLTDSLSSLNHKNGGPPGA